MTLFNVSIPLIASAILGVLSYLWARRQGEAVKAKNCREPHNFLFVAIETATAGTPWPRIEVRCGRCGETRFIGCDIPHVNSLGGCARNGNPYRWHDGDLLVTPEGYQDYFVTRVDESRILSHNAGGSYHLNQLTDVRKCYSDDNQPAE